MFDLITNIQEDFSQNLKFMRYRICKVLFQILEYISPYQIIERFTSQNSHPNLLLYVGAYYILFNLWHGWISVENGKKSNVRFRKSNITNT